MNLWHGIWNAHGTVWTTNTETVGNVWEGANVIQPQPCEGCGLNYLTCTVNALFPHNEAVCVAYKRGYEDGVAAAKREGEANDSKKEEECSGAKAIKGNGPIY